MITKIRVIFYLFLAISSLLALKLENIKYIAIVLMTIFVYSSFTLIRVFLTDPKRIRLRAILREAEREIVENGAISLSNKSAIENIQKEYQSEKYREWKRDSEIRKRFN